MDIMSKTSIILRSITYNFIYFLDYIINCYHITFTFIPIFLMFSPFSPVSEVLSRVNKRNQLPEKVPKKVPKKVPNLKKVPKVPKS